MISQFDRHNKCNPKKIKNITRQNDDANKYASSIILEIIKHGIK